MHASADSKTVLQHYVAAVQAGDLQKIRDIFAPDAVWQLDGELPISGTWRGREAILSAASMLLRFGCVVVPSTASHSGPERRSSRSALTLRSTCASTSPCFLASRRWQWSMASWPAPTRT